MPSSDTFAFFGRVYPERASVGMGDSFELHHEGVFDELEIEFFIHGSQVLVETTPKSDVDNLHTLRNVTQGAVESVTNPLSFLRGHHVDVELDAVITPTGHKRVFGVEYEYISEKLSREQVGEEWLPMIVGIYQTDVAPYLQRCFRDYKLAMEHPEDTGFYCFRAVESLRHAVKKETDSKNESWETFRNKVGINEETIRDGIQTYSKKRRHGEVTTISADERKVVLETTWEIIKKFIEYADSEFSESSS